MTFRDAARIAWEAKFGDCDGTCEVCGCYLHPDSVPHHRKGFQGGLGGRRRHDPEGFKWVCPECHRREHE